MEIRRLNICLFILILIFQTGFAQVEYFNRVFKYNVTNALFGVIEKDTFFYTAGTIRDSININSVRVFINKYSQNGDIVWNKSWGEANKEYAASWKSPIIATHDNGFAIIGGIRDSTMTWHSFLMKHNSDGDTLWKKDFYDTISIYTYNHLAFNNFKETSDKGFIIVGEIHATNQYDTEIYLIKTDSLGETEWFNTYGHPLTIDRGVSVIQTPDSGYLIGGFQYRPGVAYSGDGIIIKTDKDGNKEWEKTIGGPYKDFIAYVTLSYDSNYLVALPYAYQEVLPGYPAREINVLKVTPSKQVIWSKHYRIHCKQTVENIIELSNRDIVIVGYSLICDTINGASGDEGFIFMLNENGDSLWYRDYSFQSYLVNGSSNRLLDLKPTTDGGFVACGYFINYYQPFPQSGWLVKTDSMGCDTPGCWIVGLKEPQIAWDVEEVSVYPNPASDFISIELNFPFTESLDFELINCFGRKVKEVKLTKPSTTVSIAETKSGMYFYRVMSRDQVIGKGKVLVIR